MGRGYGWLLRRVLQALVDAGPGSLLGREALLGAGWPEVHIRTDSAHARLHVAISTLRKLGLGDALVTGDVAYGLSSEVIIEP